MDDEDLDAPNDERPIRSVVYLIAAISNRYMASGSALFLRKIGVGVGERAVMATLARKPGANAKAIGEVIGSDKAAISRSIKALERAALIEPTPATAALRSRGYRLTRQGRAINARMSVWSAEREARLLKSLTPAEIDGLIDVLGRVLARTGEVAAYDPDDG
jgi:DNA-binding MarR family transcriptional regulator